MEKVLAWAGSKTCTAPEEPISSPGTRLTLSPRPLPRPAMSTWASDGRVGHSVGSAEGCKGG